MSDINIIDRNLRLIDRKDCLLLVIDVQEKLLPFIAHKERMVENIIKLIKFSQIIDMPVLITEQEKLGPTVTEIKIEQSELQPIPKVMYSCFKCDEFIDKLQKIGKNTLILTGMETHICILQTALHALPDYTVHIVSDAVSSRFINNWTVGLERLRMAGAVISSTEMVIFELLRQSGTDEFRSTLPLVK